jgi:hypothetical protein
MSAINADRYHWSIDATSVRPSKPLRQSAFARLLARLHQSRQLQADREIRRYQALIQAARDFKVHSRDR